MAKAAPFWPARSPFPSPLCRRRLSIASRMRPKPWLLRCRLATANSGLPSSTTTRALRSQRAWVSLGKGVQREKASPNGRPRYDDCLRYRNAERPHVAPL